MPHKPERLVRNKLGRYERALRPWNPDLWDEGWVDNRGRFRVWRPDCPRAFPSGYAFRAHVMYWLGTGDVHPQGTELHHKNHNPLDDRLENLVPLTPSEHRREHEGDTRVTVTCSNCGKLVKKFKWRVRYERNFCNHACYTAAPKTSLTKKRQSIGLKKAYSEGRR